MKKFRKPLIVFTLKSLLRDSRCVSTIEEFENGSFQETIDDDAVNKADVWFSVLVNSITSLPPKRKMNVET
jgi:2-oxoglutarate dehydrogenase complex dehydrogenase (E1) component-like enzyme